MEPDDDGRVFFGQLRGCSEKATSVAGDRLEESLRRDAQGKRSSIINRQATCEIAIVKTRATEGEADLRWIDARDQIADCLTKHASRNSEEVLQEVINRGVSRERKRCWRHDGTRERPRKFRQEARKGGAHGSNYFGRLRTLKFVQCLIYPQRNSHVCD